MCSLETKTVCQTAGAQIVTLGVVITNASTGCNPATLTINAAATISGPSAATAVIAPTSVTLSPRNSTAGLVTVTLPAGHAVGKYTVTVTLTGGFTTRVCTSDMAVTSVFGMRELEGNVCTVAGFPVHKKYRLINKTGTARTVNWTATSVQNASSAGGPGVANDHYPIEICSLPLPAGNPLSTVIPTRTGTVTIPAGVNEFVDVCLNTKSYGGCQAGSNCCITLVATDVASGEEGCANTDVTVVGPDWLGCEVWGRSPCDGGLGTWHWSCDLDPLTSEPNNTEHFGVQELGGLLYISAKGLGGTPPHKIYVVDQSCCLVGNFDQPGVTAASPCGVYDGATDGTRLCFGSEEGIFVMDTGGTLDATLATLNNPGGAALGANPITGAGLALLGNYRALAYDPAGNGGDGSFWAANLTSELIEIDLAGNILTNHPNGGWSAAGLALDPTCPGTIWVNSAPTLGKIAEIDLGLGVLTGTSFGRRHTGSTEGGLCSVPGGWAGSGYDLDLVGLDQFAEDAVTAYRIHYYGLNGKQECKLVTTHVPQGGPPSQRDASDKSVFDGDLIGWGWDPDPSLVGRPGSIHVAVDYGPVQDATRRVGTAGLPEFHTLNYLSFPYPAVLPYVLADGYGIGSLFGIPIGVGPDNLGQPDVQIPLAPPSLSIFKEGDVLKLQGTYFEPQSPWSVVSTNAVYFRFLGANCQPPLPLALDDDDFIEVTFASLPCSPFTDFAFYGTSYTSIFVNSNGSIGFGAGDADFAADVTSFQNGIPRAAGMWTDLSPQLGGTVTVSSDPIIGVTTSFSNVPEFGTTSTSSFDMLLDATGQTVLLNYAPSPAHFTATLVGITPGGGATDPTGGLGTSFDSLAGGGAQAGTASDMIYEINFIGPVPNLNWLQIAFPNSDGSAFIVN